ncbi:MAG TPA: hypothetical protein VKU80_17930 [Planctomycetota bacterium]|nr:hypothetical protein [Planctomycetota bacterium]
MKSDRQGRARGEVAKACMACERFGILPAKPAVDPAGMSTDEADRLCTEHRARVLSGYCLLCGKAEMWASPFSDPSIGCCRTCIFRHHGLNAARRIEVELERDEEEGSGDDGQTPGSWNWN